MPSSMLTPKEMLDLPLVWSTLMARLTGIDGEYDLLLFVVGKCAGPS